jgi:hypothetical protein
MAFATLTLSSVQGQSSVPTTPSVLIGKVDSISSGTLVVNGIPVDIAQSGFDVTTVQIGMLVNITGSIQNGVLTATTIVIINTQPENTPEATAEMTATLVSTPESTPPLTPVFTPTANPAGDAVLIVVEGPVQKINVNIITIYDIDIQVKQDDPILTQIHLGDIVRVEGSSNFAGDRIVIVAVTVVIVQTEVVVVNGPRQVVVPVGCKVSKKGKIKCSKKH